MYPRQYLVCVGILPKVVRLQNVHVSGKRAGTRLMAAVELGRGYI